MHEVWHDQFTETQRSTLSALSTACAAMSIGGAALVLATWLAFPRQRKLRLHLAACLALSDLGAAITHLVGTVESPALCTASGFSRHFLHLSSVLWTAAVASTLHAATCAAAPVRESDTELRMRYYHLLVWGSAFILALLPLTTGSYGQVGGGCWIFVTDEWELDPGTAWRYVAFYAVVWGVIAGEARTYFNVRRRLRAMAAQLAPHQGCAAAAAAAATAATQQQQQQQQSMRRFVTRLYRYPAALVFCWGAATANHVQESLHPGRQVWWLLLAQALTLNLAGLVNALLYGLTDDVRACWREQLCRGLCGGAGAASSCSRPGGAGASAGVLNCKEGAGGAAPVACAGEAAVAARAFGAKAAALP